MNIKNKKLFLKMLRIRMVEECISKRYSEWKMRCPVHLSIGQEAPAVGVIENLSKEDKIVTAHRSHAHYLAKGGDLKSMISELYGKETGCAKGKGGSMHLIDLKAGIVAAVPIVGSTIPIGVGLSWRIKLKKKKNIVAIFFGEGATEEGVFQESLDFASLHSLPALFVCENNEFSVYSHIKKRQAKKRNILKIAKALGINSTKLPGDDVTKIYNLSAKIIKNIKKNSKPHLIIIDTFRHLEHCGPNNDDHLAYRSKTYIKKWLNNDPLKKIEKKFLTSNCMSNNDLNTIKIKIEKEISSAFQFAESSKFPSKRLLLQDIYAD